MPINKPIDCSIPFREFKQSVISATKLQVMAYINSRNGYNSFHYLLSRPPIERNLTKKKINFLMKHALRLGIDPNNYFSSCLNGFDERMQWNNTPLHLCIAYENMDLIPFFLKIAKVNGFDINLNAMDNIGKTPLMFAIKIGWTPIEIIELLMTNENYNLAENSGMTPIMLACALRRTDIVSLLIQAEADRLNLGVIDFSNPSKEQILGLYPFIHQAHPTTGKTLGHYAVMRSGTLKDQEKKPLDYQETVINILKAAAIDGFRDENARYNCIISSKSNHFTIPDGMKGISTGIAYLGLQDYGGKFFLSSLENKEELLKYDLLGEREYIDNLFKSFSGKSLMSSIFKNTQAMVNLLGALKFDFSIAQKNGKTVVNYIDILKEPEFAKSITQLDRDYLYGLKNISRNTNANSFFAEQSSEAAEVVENTLPKVSSLLK